MLVDNTAGGQPFARQTELLFTTAEDFNRWLNAINGDLQRDVRAIFGAPTPSFTVTTEEA